MKKYFYWSVGLNAILYVAILIHPSLIQDYFRWLFWVTGLTPPR